MRKIIAILIFAFTQIIYAQTALDEKIDEGIEFYKNGEEKKALKIWKEVEKKADKPSSTYGTTLYNILYYYSQEKDEANMLEYYNKIINSKLNDKDKNFELGEPFKNYRYQATRSIAGHYAKNKNFNEALKFVEAADTVYTYHSTSLTSIIFQKVDLAFFKYQLYTDLGQKDKAIAALIQRALEYNYSGMYLEWATFSNSKSEQELAEKIISEIKDIDTFKKELDAAIDNIKLKGNTITLSLNQRDYNINMYKEVKNIEEAKAYIKDSYFYSALNQ